jgi:hypothetical protein
VLIPKLAVLVGIVVLCGCAKEKSDPAPESPTRAASAAAPPPSTAASTVASAQPSGATPSPDAASPPSSDAGAKAKVDPKADEPPPNVKIVTIGMHVAGGPFDEPTKVPFKKVVEPRFPELARCWRLVNNPKTADVGVDLLIEPGGGKPKVSNPRSSIDGEGFLPCVVAFFESMDFDKPKNGRTGVSYSVRFKP